MKSWGEVRREYGLRVEDKPVAREKRGRKIIFWFDSGRANVSTIIFQLKKAGAPIEVIWDESAGMTGICLN